MIISLLAGVYIYTKYCTQPSKILLGNEFILDYKSTYNSEMKNLINSIKLISINYMFSTNNTMHKFGIEYSYIATAMGTMLQPTDNNVKSMGINQTNAVAIDWNYWGTILLVAFIVTVAAAIIFAPETGGLSLYIGYMITMDFLGGVAEIAALHSITGRW